MKRIWLIKEFYKKNLLAVVFLLVFMGVSIFNAVELLGYIGYNTYALQMMDKLRLDDGFYCMSASRQDDLTTVINPETFPAVEMVIRPKTDFVVHGDDHWANIMLYDDQVLERFRFLDKGKWLTESSHDPNQPVEVVLCGQAFDGVAIGETLPINHIGPDGAVDWQAEVKVIGKDEEPTMAFSFGTSGDRVTAADIFANVTNAIYMNKADYLRLSGADRSQAHSHFMVLFRPDADEASRQAVLDAAEAQGRYNTFDQIREYSREDLSAQLKRELPEPLFTLCVSVFAMISISVLLTHKQMRDYRIYYLVGCPRRTCFVSTFLSIFLIGLVAGLVNIGYLLYFFNNFSMIQAEDSFKYGRYLIMNSSYLYITLFVLLASFLSVLIPFGILRKQTTIELYGGRK